MLLFLFHNYFFFLVLPIRQDWRKLNTATWLEPVIWVEAGTPRIIMRDDSLTSVVIRVPDRYSMTEEGKWHFVAFTYSQETGKGAIYMDDKKGYHIVGEADPVFVSRNHDFYKYYRVVYI